MRALPASLLAHLAARKDLIVRQALWIEARNRSTGAAETIGLWTGDADISVTVGAVARTYIGAGGLLELPEMSIGVGLDVRSYGVTVSAIAPEAQQALQGYDARLARCDIHSLFFDPEAPNTLLSVPVRKFVGWIDAADMIEGRDGSFVANLTLVSQARGLSVAVQAFRSDATYRAQRADDAIGRYASVADTPVYWGQARERAGGSTSGGGSNSSVAANTPGVWRPGDGGR